MRERDGRRGRGEKARGARGEVRTKRMMRGDERQCGALVICAWRLSRGLESARKCRVGLLMEGREGPFVHHNVEAAAAAGVALAGVALAGAALGALLARSKLPPPP